MNRTRSAVERMARQPVPTDDQVRRAVLGSEPDRLLHGIVNDARRVRTLPGRAPGPRRWGPVAVVGVAVVAVLAAVAVFVLPGAVGDRPPDGVAGQPPAPALTTATDPAEVLGQLADRAAAQPIPEGRFDYIHTRYWEPPQLPNGAQDLDADVVQREVETWRNATGGRAAQSTDGRIVDDTGLVARPRVDLPAEPDALDRVLRAQPAGYFTDARPCIAMHWIWLEQVVEPRAQAAFLRLLATLDEVRSVGPVTDRLGRQGIAFEVVDRGEVPGQPVDPTPAVIEHTLVFDARTGAILTAEIVLAEGGAASFPGPRPLLMERTTWVETGRVDSTDQRP